MASLLPPTVRSSYWQLSRAPRYSVAFALPLLVAYEVSAALVNGGTGGIRNGADVLLRSVFTAVAGANGPLLFGVVLIGVMAFVIVRDRRRHGGPFSMRVFAGMMVESVALALLFGLVVGLITAQLISSLRVLALAPAQSLGLATSFVVSLGAGLYEELLFRVILVSTLVFLSRRVLGLGVVASNLLAVMCGAVIFSAFHYVGPYGDRLELGSFIFRTVAGLAFSGLYVVRGFGITAWTHALYDVFLLVAKGG